MRPCYAAVLQESSCHPTYQSQSIIGTPSVQSQYAALASDWPVCYSPGCIPGIPGTTVSKLVGPESAQRTTCLGVRCADKSVRVLRDDSVRRTSHDLARPQHSDAIRTIDLRLSPDC